jgi:hypothetical protein
MLAASIRAMNFTDIFMLVIYLTELQEYKFMGNIIMQVFEFEIRCYHYSGVCRVPDNTAVS